MRLLAVQEPTSTKSASPQTFRARNGSMELRKRLLNLLTETRGRQTGLVARETKLSSREPRSSKLISAKSSKGAPSGSSSGTYKDSTESLNTITSSLRRKSTSSTTTQRLTSLRLQLVRWHPNTLLLCLTPFPNIIVNTSRRRKLFISTHSI